MPPSSKHFELRKFIRRFFSRWFYEFFRFGKITQTLWDAAQIQGSEHSLRLKAGERALELIEKGELQDTELVHLAEKISRLNRILKRQELLLKSYQNRGDLKEVLRRDRIENKDRLAPV